MSDRRRALVTGASAGVGRAVAVGLAQEGFDVALVARGRAGLESAAKDVEEHGSAALVLTADVSRPDEVEEAADSAERELGPLDVWVNDAMTTIFAPIWKIEADDFRRAIEVTFLGQVWGTTAALRRMMPRDSGTIVNVGSALSFEGIPLQSAYCAAKFACRGFFESTRAELLHEGSNVRLCMVHLPGLNTPQFGWCKSVFDRHPMPVPPIYQPELAAKAIVRTALDGRRSRIVGSWNQLLVMVASAMPGVANHYAAEAAWDGQLTDQPVAPDRPANLWEPLDAGEDRGAHGEFDDRAHGVRDPKFLASLPETARNFGRALRAAAAEKAEGRAARRRS